MKTVALLALTICLSTLSLYSQKNSSTTSAEDWKCGSYSENPLLKNRSLPWYQDYDTKFAHIDIALTDTSNDISGNVTYAAHVGVNGMDSLNFQLVSELIIDSILVDNVTSSFTRQNEVTTVNLIASMIAGQLFTWKVYYHGKPTNPSAYRGLYHATDDVYGIENTYTLSESFHLKEWLPCKEDLVDKIDSAWTFITVDTSLKAGSNGLLTQITNIAPGKHRFEWKTRYPMVYYMLSANVADYLEYNIYAHPQGIADSILVQNYIYDHSNALSIMKPDLDRTPWMIDYYSGLFGIYPFYEEKYGHCQVELNGAMEHQTMTTGGSLWDWVIAHELAHQWFGDYVTCANWQDIFVNEGWATYSELLFYEGDGDITRMTSWVTDTYKRAKKEPTGSVFVPFADAANEGRLFSYNLSYKKGGAILRMLRYVINNDSLFFAGVKQFIIQYGNSNATGENFKDVMATASGMNLDEYFNQWYYGEGFPIYDAIWYNSPGTPNNVDISLSVAGTSTNTPYFSIPVLMKLNLSDGTDTIVKLFPTGASNSFSVNTGSLSCQSVVFDPGDYVVDSLRSFSQGSPELNLSPMYVYFNETENFIDVHISHNHLLPLTLTMFSTDGKAVETFTITQTDTRLNIDHLAKNVYIINVRSEAVNFNKKISKIR